MSRLLCSTLLFFRLTLVTCPGIGTLLSPLPSRAGGSSCGLGISSCCSASGAILLKNDTLRWCSLVELPSPPSAWVCERFCELLCDKTENGSHEDTERERAMTVGAPGKPEHPRTHLLRKRTEAQMICSSLSLTLSSLLHHPARDGDRGGSTR